MVGFDSKDVFLGFPCFFLKWKQQQKTSFLFFWMDIINQNIKQNPKTLAFFGSWNFSMQKTTPKMLKKQIILKFYFSFLISWLIHIHSNNQNNKVFVFSISKQKNIGTTKKTFFESKPNILLNKCFLFCLSFFKVFQVLFVFSRRGPRQVWL